MLAVPHRAALGRHGLSVAAGAPRGPGDAEGRWRGNWERLSVEVDGRHEDLGPVWPTLWTLSETVGANLSEPLVLEAPADAAVLVLSLRALATDPAWNVAFHDVSGATARPWQSRPVLGPLLFGDGGRPFRLWAPEGVGPGPVFLPPGGRVEAVVGDLSGAPNTVHLVVEGLRLERGRADVGLLWWAAAETLFVYAVDFTAPVAATPTPQASVRMAGNVPWVLHSVQAQPLADWSLQLRTSANAEPWFLGGNYVPVECLAGDGLEPGGMTLPRGVARNDTLEVYAVSRTGAPVVVDQLALVGTKDWRRAQP